MSLVILALLSFSLFAPVSAPPGYERAARAVPARHWALVREIHVDRDSSGQARRADMSVHLTPHRADSQLFHEIGHLVMYADSQIEADWQAAFWAGGKLRGVAPSRYARTNDREDFAEAYAEILEHGCLEDLERDRFLKERVFRPGELPSPCLD